MTKTQEPSSTTQVGWQPAVVPVTILLHHITKEKYPQNLARVGAEERFIRTDLDGIDTA